MKSTHHLSISALCLSLVGLVFSSEAQARRSAERHEHSHSARARHVSSAPARSASRGRRASDAPRQRVERREARPQERRVTRRAERRHERRHERRVSRRAERKVARRVARAQSSRRSYYRGYRRHRPFRAIPAARPALHRHHHDLHHHTRHCGHERSRIFQELYTDPVYFGVNNDFSDEERRIDRGALDGRLTPREVRRLKGMLWEARALERDALYDGLLTSEEEADLYWAERELNREIRGELDDFEQW